MKKQTQQHDHGISPQNQTIINPDELASLKMSRLINSHYYSLDCVFILQGENQQGYRLVFHHVDKILMDGAYRSVRGAKIAFAKYCQSRAYQEDVKPEWTDFYPPDADWLEQKLACKREIIFERIQAAHTGGIHVSD